MTILDEATDEAELGEALNIALGGSDVHVRQDIADAIYAAIKAADNDPVRGHLGASVMGQECARRQQLTFYWCAEEDQDGRMLALFDRGKREEAVISANLQRAGITVMQTRPGTGEQFRYKRHGGHMAGSMDAALVGVPGEPRAWHLGEFKTMNRSNFGQVKLHGVRKSHFEYFIQMQLYMRWSGLTKALFIAVCKDTDHIHIETVHYDAEIAAGAEAKGERVIFSTEPLRKISDKPDFFQCKLCPAVDLCKGKAMPPVNCRTCAHSTPERDGDARWTCASRGVDIPLDRQVIGCNRHVFNPHLLVNIAKYTGGNHEENWAEYELPNGQKIRNGTAAPGVHASSELIHMPLVEPVPAEAMDAFTVLRETMGARFVEPNADEVYNDYGNAIARADEVAKQIEAYKTAKTAKSKKARGKK